MSEISKLNSLNPQPLSEKPKKVTEDKLQEVADLYEKHFIREMMKQMRKTVQESGFIKQNNAEKIFRDQLDDQYADEWGKSGGIGLSGLIYDQLMDKFGEQFGLKEKIAKPIGPLPLNVRSQYQGMNTSSASTKPDQSPEFKIQLQAEGQSPVDIQNPWAGVLLDKKFINMDQMQYRIKHDNGLESTIVARGTGLGSEQKLSLGDQIQAGQVLGKAQASSPLFWSVKTIVSE